MTNSFVGSQGREWGNDDDRKNSILRLSARLNGFGPTGPDVRPQSPPQAAAAIRSPFADGRPPRILLVDDEPINLKVVRKYLSGAGYTEIHSTCNATEVLPMMIRAEPDVVLLDIVMPNFNGLGSRCWRGSAAMRSSNTSRSSC